MKLDTFESDLRKDVRTRARAARQVSPRKTFLLTAFVTPFLAVEALFVPFLGQALFLAAIIISLFYLWAIRSLAVTLAGSAGIIASALALIAVPTPDLFSRAPLFVYLMFGLCTAATISYILIVASALWLHYERGSERHPSGSNSPLA